MNTPDDASEDNFQEALNGRGEEQAFVPSPPLGAPPRGNRSTRSSGESGVRSPLLAGRMLYRASVMSNQESLTNSSQVSMTMDESSAGYHAIRIDGDECDTDFVKSAELIASIITSRASYKTTDKGQQEEPFADIVMRTIDLLSPSPEPSTSGVAKAASEERADDNPFATTLPYPVTPVGSSEARASKWGSVASASPAAPKSFLTYEGGIFTFPEMKTPVISWKQFVKDIRRVYGAIENGPCLSVARMRLTIVAQKFQLYSLLNSRYENSCDEYLKGGVYSTSTKIDNALHMEASVTAPTLLEFIVNTAKENPRVPLFVNPATKATVSISKFLEDEGVTNPEEITISGLGLHPSLLIKKFSTDRPTGFARNLIQSFLSIAGPNNGDLYGGLLRSELERDEFREHVVCTERLICIHGHHESEIMEVASWIRRQGFHSFSRNQWVLSLDTRMPEPGPNSLPVTAKTVDDRLHNIFYPLFMATLYPEHNEWRDVAQMLLHTSAISISTLGLARMNNMPEAPIHPSSISYNSNVSDYYYYFYFWSNFSSLNALRRSLNLNLLQFTSSINEKPPQFDQLVCSFLLCDVVYHAPSLHKSWIMQYLYMMCRIGIVLSPIRDNLQGVPYFDHPVVQYFAQGMQVSLSTSQPLHYHHRVDQPLMEEYATLMKLFSLSPQDVSELARNSVFNSNFKELRDSAGANADIEFASCICNYRLLFRRETLMHETTLLHLVRCQGAEARGEPPPEVLHSNHVSDLAPFPDLMHFGKERRLHYIDKRVVYPRINIDDLQGVSQYMSDGAELIRQVVMLRKKYITSSCTTDAKVEDVFNNPNNFQERFFEYNNFYGVYVLSRVGKNPSWPSFIPTVEEYIKDMKSIQRAVSSLSLQRLCRHRLSLLSRKFLLHLSMNISNECGKREEKEWNNRDFFTAHKVDNNIHTDAGLNARTLLKFFMDKAQHHGDDVVFEEDSNPITLRQLLARYHIHVHRVTVDELTYQMSSHPDLRAIFLSPDNFMQGRYFAELTKRVLEIYKEDAYSFAESRLNIRGTSPDEWYMLAHWFDRYGMASSQNRWMISLPRNYRSLRQKGLVKNFGEFIDNLFSPLWDISFHPAKDPRFHYFLAHVSGFDCVDKEGRIDIPLTHTFPHDWKTDVNPPYALYLYYMWANITSLNEFRATRGLGTFTFRPQCGEFGHADHLIAGFLLANSINHGVTLARNPVLEYLYYLQQIGVAMSPLSNTSGACAYLENPFPHFFHRGLNVSLATNQPLFFHFTNEPLIEEYSIAAKLWKFEFNDLSEIARHSVLQSGFPPSWKEKALGRLYYLSSVLGNDVRKTRLSDIRVAFRFETYHSEVDFLDEQLNSLPRVPRAMKTLEEEQAIVDMDLTQTPGAIPDPELEHYVASLRRNEETRLSAATTPRTQSVRSSGAAFSDEDDKEAEAAAAAAAEEEEEDSVRIDGNIDITTMKKFMLHDIKSFEHRIRELSTCMLMLAGSNDTMSREINAIVQNRALMEAAGATTKIRGNLVGKEPSGEDASIKSENLASSTPGPEVWVHEECHPAAAEESDSELQSDVDHK